MMRDADLPRLAAWVATWLRRVDLRTVAGVALAALLLLVFFEVVDAVTEPGTPSVDEAVLRAMRGGDAADPIGPTWLEHVALDLSALGSGPVTGYITLAVLGYMLLIGKRRMALVVLVAVTGVWALMFLLKDLYARERPDVVTALGDVPGLSFPSGHAMVSAALYPTLALLLSSVVRPLRVKLYLVALALGLAVTVGLTRVYLGVHYPSDVVGGWAIGAAWALTCGIVARALQRRRVVESAT